ncbi:OmpA family protein [Endozoicomonas sp. GU-1]|uniref:OmpA family protein n=1 Tax=Endozoicomonas sp. GU-1 TaxID=3009078 RepID=UPI0022B3839C|nr:OmpA family protein [Endozoicomonas sp. GU-1]WBA81812.1 OmpA family protein [Endozoicomonas sp. GU-1]WBA84766.1 OmpA family protein [Endozoicomonas sp. GU-1]
MKVQGFARSLIAIAIGTTLSSSVIASDMASQVVDKGLTFTVGGAWNDLDSNRGLDNALAPEIGIGYRLNDRFSVEGIYSQYSTEQKTGPDADLKEFRLDAFYDLTPWDGSLTPYVVAGISELEADYEMGGEHDDTRMNAGFGLRKAFTPNLAIRGDVRAVRTLDYAQTEAMANVALTWTFGSVAKAAEPVAMVEPVQEEVVASVEPAPVLDADNDGVLDKDDLCPNTAAGITVDQTGCEPMTAIDLLVNFDFDSETINPEGIDQIAKMGEFLQRYPNVRIRIEGHTDAQGKATYNEQLSVRRADIIRQQLIDTHGVDAGRIDAVGMGESKPVASNDTAEGRQQNRRVTAEVIGS